MAELAGGGEGVSTGGEAGAGEAAAPAAPVAAEPAGVAALQTPAEPVVTPAAEGGASEWYSGLSDENRTWVAAKGWEDHDSQVTSHLNLEKLQGADAEHLVKLPAGPDDKEAWDAVYTKMGVPESSEGYDFSRVAIAEGMHDLRPVFSDWAAEAKLQPWQAELLANKLTGSSAEQIAAIEAQGLQAITEQDAELHTEWGQEYDPNIAAGKAFAAQFGITNGELESLQQSMGWGPLARFMAKAGRAIGELAMPTTEGGSSGMEFGLTPDAAKGKIQELHKDEAFNKVYWGDKGPAHTEAVKKMEALMKIAHPETSQAEGA